MWSMLEHPNVLPLLGIAQYDGYCGLVSDWMENRTLWYDNWHTLGVGAWQMV